LRTTDENVLAKDASKVGWVGVQWFGQKTHTYTIYCMHFEQMNNECTPNRALFYYAIRRTFMLQLGGARTQRTFGQFDQKSGMPRSRSGRQR
jgi:hypothetical protein